MRFKGGDACRSILGQGYDVGPVETRACHWLATTAGPSEFGTGRAMVGVFHDFLMAMDELS